MYALALLLILLVSPVTVSAAVQCVDAEGEAVIVNNDLPSAKAEAITRAKWAAIEQSVGVDVNAQSVVQNMMLVDEAVNKKIHGLVTSFKLLNHSNKDDVSTVKIKACVESTKAKDAVSDLALNNAVAVFVPVKQLPVAGRDDRYDEANLLSESIIGNLTERGYTVVDVAPTHAVDARKVEDALKSGNFLTLNSLMYKFLTNVLLIGKVEYTISSKKGEDLGFGIGMPFNSVTARLTYRLVARDPSGKMVILTAGSEQGKGLASNVEDAAAKGLQVLSDKVRPVIEEKIGNYIRGATKKVAVKVAGIKELSENFAIKETFQNIAWVTNVEEKGLGEFVVSYPENTIYLANSINQKGDLKVSSFTKYSIDVHYMK